MAAEDARLDAAELSACPSGRAPARRGLAAAPARRREAFAADRPPAAARVPAVSWEPELEELRRREELARQMGGEERVERQHASGRLTVRERIERLFDAGSFHETGALAGRGDLRRGRRADGLPARQHGRRPGPHRRAPRGRAGRRLHGPRRRRRRRDLGEGRLRRAARARPAPPARAARRRHGRRRVGQVARADGLLLRAAAAGLRPGGGEPVARAGGGRPRSARSPASAPRAWCARTSR